MPGTGAMTTMLEKAPSGKTMFCVPCPGQMKFHVLFDDVTQLFWLLSTQATDSMIRPDRMPEIATVCPITNAAACNQISKTWWTALRRPGGCRIWLKRPRGITPPW